MHAVVDDDDNDDDGDADRKEPGSVLLLLYEAYAFVRFGFSFIKVI